MNEEIEDAESVIAEKGRFDGKDGHFVTLAEKKEKEKEDLMGRAALDKIRGDNEYMISFRKALQTHQRPDTAMAIEEFNPLTKALTITGGSTAGEDGGFLVPLDFDKKIIAETKDFLDISTLCNTEMVTTNSGWRAVEVAGQRTKLPKVDEMATIGKNNQPKFKKVTFTLSQYGDRLPVSNQLIQDVDYLMTYLAGWFGPKLILTKNDLVLTLVGRIWYMDPAQKDKSTLKLLVSLDNHNFDLVETLYPTEEANDAQKLTYDLTEYVKGYGRAYVQLQFLVFDSPHTIGFRSVTLTANTAGISDDTGSSKMPVSNVQSFTSLPVGAASAEALGAEKSANLTFGLNRVPLLTARESGEDAYGIWKITAAEGETFDDAHLTLIGKTGFVNADKKDTSFLKVTVSTDGESYSEVQTFTATEETSDTQKLSMDLTNFVYGANQIYVKLYFSSEDDPTAFGLRSLALVGNAGEDYDDFTPAVEDVVIPEGRATTAPSGTQGTASGTTAGDGPSAPAGFPWWGIVLIVIAVLGAAGAAVWLVLKRKKAAPTQK